MNSSFLSRALDIVTTGSPTIASPSVSVGLDGTRAKLKEQGLFNDSVHSNFTGVLEEGTDSDETELLSLRFVIIAVVVVGIFLLAWGSYSIHKHCRMGVSRYKRAWSSQL